MNMSIDVASAILLRIQEDCKRNKDGFGEDAISVALEYIKEHEKRKINQYASEDIKAKFIDSALPFLLSYLRASLSQCNDKDRKILADMLNPMKEIVENLALLQGEDKIQ